MLNTPLTRLRKDAPGSLTAAKVSAFFKKRRYPRDRRTIDAFERGSFQAPRDRFFELYAEFIGAPVEVVRRAYARTRQMRERGTGPFAAANRVA